VRRPATTILLAGSLLAGAHPAAAQAPGAPAAPTSGPEVQPDVVVVMVDDLGYVPDERILERLPEISDLWVDGGRRFRQMYDETPLCCPSRATLLTGRHTLGHGVITNDGDAMDGSDTIATSLSAAGYHTILAGKYLNEYEGTRTPPGWDHVMMRESETIPSYTLDGELVTYEGEHFDDVLRRQAVAWVEEAPADEPLFALVTPRAPHRHPQRCGAGDTGCRYQPLVMEQDRGAEACADIAPWKPPDYETPESDRPVPWVMPDWPDGWPLRQACESLLVVDRMVGQLVEAQAERGRPAWYFFLSDNGMAWGRRGFPAKHVPPATRLPFYVAGPGVGPGDEDALLTNVDLAATIADLAGAEPPFTEGTSFVPLLTAAGDAGHEEILEIMPADPAGIYEGWAALRTPRLRYIRWDSGRQELYDLDADPWEMEDLSKKRRRLVATLDARLDELVAASTTGSVVVPSPPPGDGAAGD
jgi:arylsulfatase A-like enzyme